MLIYSAYAFAWQRTIGDLGGIAIVHNKRHPSVNVYQNNMIRYDTIPYEKFWKKATKNFNKTVELKHK